MAGLSRIPLLYQPGEAWLYDTCSALQGVLIARVSGQPLPEFMAAERVFEPLGMTDTGFCVPAATSPPLPARSPSCSPRWRRTAPPPSSRCATSGATRPAPPDRPATTNSSEQQRIWAYHDGVDLGGPAMARIARDYGCMLAELRKL
ncbi:MAG TPA: serine hydrolase [Streptosporangiaceae bacterium]